MGYVSSPPYQGGVGVASETLKSAELKADDSVLIWEKRQETKKQTDT
jgi:hypothetical protein